MRVRNATGFFVSMLGAIRSVALFDREFLREMVLAARNEEALAVIPLDVLKQHALDLQ